MPGRGLPLPPGTGESDQDRSRIRVAEPEDRMSLKSLLLFCLMLAAFPLKAGVPFWGAKEPRPFDTPFGELQPGEYTWAPEVSPGGPILVVVSLDEQRAFVYRNGILIGRTTVSTGKKGHETPTGIFKTTLKDADHRSSKYHNAPMPFTQRFTADGVALHAGGLPGYPESHGCVHLPSALAARLFDVAPLGMTIVVANAATAPEEVDHPGFLSPVDMSGTASGRSRLDLAQTFRWEPELAPEGPVSIMVSRTDQRAIVLRNGVEIGRARVEIRDPELPLGTQVFQVQAGGPEGSPRWIVASMPGYGGQETAPASPEVLRRITMPEEFRTHLQGLILSGTTLVVLDAPILSRTTGVGLSILTSHPDTGG